MSQPVPIHIDMANIPVDETFSIVLTNALQHSFDDQIWQRLAALDTFDLSRTRVAEAVCCHPRPQPLSGEFLSFAYAKRAVDVEERRELSIAARKPVKGQWKPRVTSDVELFAMLRAAQEEAHRKLLFRLSIREPMHSHGIVLRDPSALSPPWPAFCLSFESKPKDHIVEAMSLSHAEDCCNKTAAVYILGRTLSGEADGRTLSDPADGRTLSDQTDEPLLRHLMVVIQRYLYKRWFVQGESELEWGRFFAKMMFVPAPSSADDLGALAALHRAVCAAADRKRDEINYATMDMGNLIAKLGAGRTVRRGKTMPIDEFREYVEANCIVDPVASLLNRRSNYVLQPVFCALAVMVPLENHTIDVGVEQAGEIKVRLLLTGDDWELSAPVDFGQIEKGKVLESDEEMRAVTVTLATAFEFISALGEREKRDGDLELGPFDLAGDDYEDGCLLGEQELRCVAAQFGREVRVSKPSHLWVRDAEAAATATLVGRVKSLLPSRLCRYVGALVRRAEEEKGEELDEAERFLAGQEKLAYNAVRKRDCPEDFVCPIMASLATRDSEVEEQWRALWANCDKGWNAGLGTLRSSDF